MTAHPVIAVPRDQTAATACPAISSAISPPRKAYLSIVGLCQIDGVTSAGGRGGGEGVDTCANSPVITGEFEGMREKGFRVQELCESRGGRP